MLINKELTIDGHGNTVNAKKLSNSKIFHISTSSKVVIKNLIITGATNNAVYVYSSDANFEFINCTFKNNVRSAAPAFGAAICCENTVSSFKFTNVTFDTNTVTCSLNYDQYYAYGGAIYFKTTANGKFENVTFTNNKVMATEKTNGRGGAIYFGAAANDIDFIKCNFIGNTARSNGGAIYYYSTSSNNRFINTTFRDNKVTTVKTTENYGGAICFNGDIKNNSFTNVNFTNNQAPFAGAIYLKLASGLEFNDVNFTKNGATATNTGNGGAVYISSNTIYGKFNHVTFDENTAKSSGGAIYFNSIVTSNNFTNVSFIRNDAQGRGGAIYFNYGVTGVEFNTVNFTSNNASSYGGAIAIFPRTGGPYGQFSNSKFINTNFTDNFAKYCGGAISTSASFNKNEFSDVNFVENSVSYNTNSYFGGGAFYSSYEVADNLFTRVNFTNNSAGKGITAPQMSGGAMLIGSISRNNTFNQSNFINNYAKSGGAIKYSSTSDGDSFINTVFEDNVAEDNGYPNQGYGGAIYYSSVTSQNLENTKFIHNHADNYGGAICTFAPLNISGPQFINCSAKEGGAIYANCSNLTVSDSTFTNNTAHSGGAIQYFGNSLKVSDTTMLENKADSTDILLSLDKNILTVVLKGNENYLNAILSNCTPEFKNVTYWNGNNVNTDNHDDNTSYNETGQNITLKIYKNGQLKDTAYLVTSTSGKATYDFSTLGSGTYTYEAKHPDSTYYTPIDKTGTVTVDPFSIDVNLTVNVENNVYGQNTTIKVTLKDINGNNLTGVIVNVTIDNVPYEVTITNGRGSRNVSGLAAKDNYLANATFAGNASYASANATDYFNVTKALSLISIHEILNVTYNNTITVIFDVSNATKVTYVVKTKDGLTVVVTNKTVSNVNETDNVLALPVLGVGNYTITIANDDNENYTGDVKSADFTVNMASSSVVIDPIVNVTYPANTVINFTVTNATNVTWTIRNKVTQAVISVNSLDNISIALEAGNYTITIVNDDTINVTGSDASSDFTVYKAGSSVVISPIVNVTYPANTVINFTVTNATNVTYIVKTQDGTVAVQNTTANATSFKLPVLTPGNYVITIANAENGNYTGDVKSAEFTVKKVSLYASDMKRGWDSPYDYQVKLTDGDGNGIEGKTIVFTINSKQYNATTDGNGIAKLTTSKLDVGKYNVTVTNPVTGENATAKITIVARIIENDDLTKDYESSKHYTVCAIGDDGNAVGSGVVVVMKVNGVTYKIKTDKNGYATLPIHLIPKKYTITATYHEYTVKNKITVKQTLKLVKKTVKVKKGKKIVLKAKLKWSNGKAIKGKVIKFKFKGKTYTAKTNKKGIAKVTIKKKKVLKKLKKGKKYAYSAKYIKHRVKGKVKIKK